MRCKIMGKMIIGALAFVLISAGFAWAESLTITTYYPSPYGSYRELSAKRVKIGTTYSGSGVSITDDDLIVEGRVGIGNSDPGTFASYKMTTYGGGVLVAGIPAGGAAGFNATSIGSDSYAADFNGTFISRQNVYLATASGTVGIGIASPTTDQGGWPIKLDVQDSAMVQDVYLTNPRYGAADWVSKMIFDVNTALTAGLAGKADTSHTHSCSCSKGSCAWTGYNDDWQACSGGNLADGIGVYIDGQDARVAVRCCSYSCSCS